MVENGKERELNIMRIIKSNLKVNILKVKDGMEKYMILTILIIILYMK